MVNLLKDQELLQGLDARGINPFTAETAEFAQKISSDIRCRDESNPALGPRQRRASAFLVRRALRSL